MKVVSMDDHNFEKQNLVTTSKGYDHYKCSVCGCIGKRMGLTGNVQVSEAMFKIAKTCSHKDKVVMPVGDWKEYVVKKSPWPDELPIGSKVISIDRRNFKRKDGKRLFPKGYDNAYDKTGMFKLFANEYDEA